MVKKLADGDEAARGETLRASVLRYIPESREIADDVPEEWATKEPPIAGAVETRPQAAPREPKYPRSEALVWMALSILETAYRQMCSERHTDRFLPGIPRRLHGVHVTHPSGWSNREIALYRRKWLTAIRIFYLNHMDSRPGPNFAKEPDLYMDTDEALVSQLPFVYEEISRLGKGWIELMGRGRGAEAKVRIMSVDIGGGTTDYSIVEYYDRINTPGQVDLCATLLFKDSSSSAGDLLVKNLIERVILPYLGADFRGDEDKRRNFEEVASPDEFDFTRNEMWKRTTRLALVPLATKLLAARVAEPGGDSLRIDLEAADADEPATIRRDFNALLKKHDLEITATQILCSAQTFVECVQSTFAGVFDAIAQFVVAFKVDLIVVNGKPTEIGDVTKLLQERLPISRDRVLTAKEFPVRGWYPFRKNAKIEDAKTVTVAGAALYRALKAELFADWKVDFAESRQLRCRNYWVHIGEINADSGEPYLTPEDDEKEITILVNGRIGRQLVLGAANPEPVYQLRWARHRRQSGDLGNESVTMKLRRITPREDRPGEVGSSLAEYLKIESATGFANANGQRFKITAEDLELKLCFLSQRTFWMDDPKFEIDWGEIERQRNPGKHR
jgi:hypothetical protein